jgi:histidinol-phosphatase (PHP family)
LAPVLDYHLHLLRHGEDRGFRADDVREYARRAAAAGLTEIAVTEHLYRFEETQRMLGEWWHDEPDPVLREAIARYFEEEVVRGSLDDYAAAVAEAAADPGDGAAVRLGLEVDWFPGRMEEVAGLLGGYPFDVLLGSVHWLGAWGFDQIDDPVVMAEWSRRHPDDVWGLYTDAVEGLAQSGACDVLAHLDLVKVTGVRPDDPAPYHERMTKAAVAGGLSVEISSAGWRKPVGEEYPAPPLLESLHEAGVGVTFASDAHDASLVADRMADVARLARAAGYETLTGFTARRARPVPMGGG